MSWLKKFFSKPKEVPKEVPTYNGLLVWDVLIGPFPRNCFDEEELDKWGVSRCSRAMVYCRIEDNGKITSATLWYDTLEEAEEVVRYFKSNIQPIKLSEG